MRTTFFFFAMLASMTASAQVTNVEPVGANYANKTVSFRVWWNAGSRDATHLSKVWVWVDYLTVNNNNTTSGNTWTRATVGTISPATGISYDGTNRNGFWLEGNASTNYSATLTVQLTNVPVKFNWCAYVSDYPPNVTLDNGTYTFKGTTNFIVSSHAQPITTKTIAKTNLTVTSSTTFTDATGCPGIGGFYCPYTGSDLYMDATHLCQQRISGVQNWEAWIKDTRDNELYRIVLMPDGLWWTAEEMRYDASSTGKSYKCPTATQRTIYNRPAIACSAGWMLPTVQQILYLHSIATDQELLAANTYEFFGTGTDKYGFSIIPDGSRSDISNETYPNSCPNPFTGDFHACSWDTSDQMRLHCQSKNYAWASNDYSWNQVRCIRQL